ncbi:hypothetical protein PQR15_37635 [Streptomyces lydicus]|nr:hypothetical protein [Streptomyces lydicus]
MAAALRKPGEYADAALAVAAVAGPKTEQTLVTRLRTVHADSPLRLAEIEVILTTGPRERAVLAEDQWHGPFSGDWPPLTDPVAERTADALHAELARHVLRSAAAHLAALHAGELPYAADQAFTTADADTLRRAARLALRRDEPWAGEVFSTLLPQLAVAPTAAKTLPSQRACIALAQVVEAWPTPESVAALLRPAASSGTPESPRNSTACCAAPNATSADGPRPRSASRTSASAPTAADDSRAATTPPCSPSPTKPRSPGNVPTAAP